jgi:hypothetical protein
MWYGHLHGIKDFGVTALAFGAADTVKTLVIPTENNGVLHEINFSVPVWTNAPTLTFTLERADGTIAWTGTARSKGGVVLYFAEFPDRCIVGGETLKGTLSVGPGGAGGTVNIRYFGRGAK